MPMRGRDAMRPTKTQVVAAVERAYELAPGEIMRRSRISEIVFPRRVAWWYLSKRLGMEYSQIGRFFGMHHTSVITGVAAIDTRFADEDLAEKRLVVDKLWVKA
jgi:chromosomal replication initiation ATPase DnaA